jgi:hypothetical protein
MKKNWTLILVLLNFSLLLSFTVAGFSHPEQEKKEVRDFVIRNGLPNFFNKALNGDSIKVAYLGGSIRLKAIISKMSRRGYYLSRLKIWKK